jgi:hypothetical protein
MRVTYVLVTGAGSWGVAFDDFTKWVIEPSCKVESKTCLHTKQASGFATEIKDDHMQKHGK